MWVYLVLFAVGLVAGFVDAIAGGGGLLTVPAIMLTKLPDVLALGTNKGQGVFGTATSLRRFFASPLLDRRRAVQSFVPALIGATAGVLTLLRLKREKPAVVTPLIMVLLAAVAVFMIFYRAPKVDPTPHRRSFALTAVVAFTLAFYDGFFGPGTGTFLILAYALLWHDPLHVASANAKVVNFASNLAAMVTFWIKGWIVWEFALPMAAGQVLGGYFGAHMTIKVGRPLVRYAVIIISIALLIRLAWGLTHPH